MFTEKEIDQRKSRGNIVLLLTDNEISIQILSDTQVL
jgi:hypothetical protein